MTVTYQSKVATATGFCFLKLLLRWRGSIYKLLWKEFSIFVLLYYGISMMYRFGLSGIHKKRFEALSRYCKENSDLIPVAFVLGFYVALVVNRWWKQFEQIPWPDRMALFMSASIHGQDDRARLMRRTIMRYLSLSYVITMHSISPAVKKRFPTFSHMTEAGFMLPTEQKILEEIRAPYNKYFVPLVWSTSLVTRARKEGKLRDDMAMKTLVDEINAYRGMLGTLFNYDWVCVPLVYTQVVTIAVYMYFLSALFGRQFLTPDAPSNAEGHRVIINDAEGNIAANKTSVPWHEAWWQEIGQFKFDFYIPIFTFLQFFFYMGWLKVAETMVGPFGEDDDDFDINTTIDRNLQVSYLVVDEMHQEHPDLIKDAYWDQTDFELPYTSAAGSPVAPHLGSAMDIRIDHKHSDFVPLPSLREEGSEWSHGEAKDIPGSHRRASLLHRLLSRQESNASAGHRKRTRPILPSWNTSTPRQSHHDEKPDTWDQVTIRISKEDVSNCEFDHHSSTETMPVHTPSTGIPGDIFKMSDLELNKPEKEMNPFTFDQPPKPLKRSDQADLEAVKHIAKPESSDVSLGSSRHTIQSDTPHGSLRGGHSTGLSNITLRSGSPDVGGEADTGSFTQHSYDVIDGRKKTPSAQSNPRV